MLYQEPIGTRYLIGAGVKYEPLDTQGTIGKGAKYDLSEAVKRVSSEGKGNSLDNKVSK